MTAPSGRRRVGQVRPCRGAARAARRPPRRPRRPASSPRSPERPALVHGLLGARCHRPSRRDRAARRSDRRLTLGCVQPSRRPASSRWRRSSAAPVERRDGSSPRRAERPPCTASRSVRSRLGSSIPGTVSTTASARCPPDRGCRPRRRATADSHRGRPTLSFTAEAGEVLALLGPNGAGKTSTVETLEGYRRPDAGRVRVLGLDPDADHAELDPSHRRDAAGAAASTRASGRSRCCACSPPSTTTRRIPTSCSSGSACRTGGRTPWRQLSGGEQQRLSLALALVGRPEVAFLDEPTAGIDVAGRQRRAQRRSATCAPTACASLLTTHELEEAERLADHVVIIDHGRVVAARHAGRADDRAARDEIRFGAPPGLDVAALGARLGAPSTEVAAGEYRGRRAAGAGHGRRAHRLAGRARPRRSPTSAPAARSSRTCSCGSPTAAAATDARRRSPRRAVELDPHARAGASRCCSTLGIPVLLLVFFSLVDVLPTEQGRPGRLPRARGARARRHVDRHGRPRHRHRLRAPVRRAEAAGRHAARPPGPARGQDARRSWWSRLVQVVVLVIVALPARVGPDWLAVVAVARHAARHRRLRRHRPAHGGHDARRARDPGRRERPLPRAAAAGRHGDPARQAAGGRCAASPACCPRPRCPTRSTARLRRGATSRRAPGSVLVVWAVVAPLVAALMFRWE